jgi:hypothetical protein
MTANVTVLLQVSSGATLEDSCIQISHEQFVSLGEPVVVRCLRLEQKGMKKKGASLLCEVLVEDGIPIDSCCLSTATMSLLAIKPTECVRLSFLRRLNQGKQVDIAASEARFAELERREQLVEALQKAVIKLSHEKLWYQNQAEGFRSELEAATDELDLAMVRSCCDAIQPQGG